MFSEIKIYYFLIIISLTFATKNYDDKKDLLSSSTENDLEDDDLFVDDIDDIDDDNDEYKQNTDWDVLLFTQQWPVTTCIHWKNENKDNNCQLPNKDEFWTIHGLWPTKLGTVGPSFCNKTNHFDVNKLSSIVNNLQMYWPSIEEGISYDQFWGHEWEKHGTCAATIENLNTELKYFSTGIDWRNNFLISTILAKSGIHPDTNISVISIHNALKKQLNKNPSIHCLYDRHRDISYLSEIRICFNKTLNLVDCDGVMGLVGVDYPGGKLITNCHVSKLVVYPSAVPNKKATTWNFNFREAFKLINFIMWVTL